MSTAVWTSTQLELTSVADNALRAAARFWFVAVLIGQFTFAFAVASLYGLTALRGNLQAWNKVLPHGYVAGETLGNLALFGHVLFAAIINVGGPLQLIAQLRDRFPVFHRWNGRIYLLAAFTMGGSGLYLTLSPRTVVGDLSQHLGLWLSAVLIIVFAVMALRYALARDFKTHRRWALRLFLVASGSWMFRVGLFLSLLIFRRPVGFDPDTFTGTFVTLWTFGEFLLPLAVLELYFRAKDHPGAPRRLATASLLLVLTVGMAAGIFAVTMAVWVPNVKAAFDTRKSVAQALSETIASRGIDQAATQYHDLKAAEPAVYNFDERELNALGYEFVRARKFQEAIRIFQLNVEAYPQSSNVYDSLAEAYMDANNKPQAIANFRKSLELNPKNRGAVQKLQNLNAP